MPTFRYRAKDAAGRLISGKVEAATGAIAEQTLTERNLRIVLLETAPERFRLPFVNRVRARDLVIFSRQLATLTGANVSLVRALKTLVSQTANPALRQALAQVADEVEAGTRLSRALGKHPRIFNTFFINMVRSGETAGRLAEVLNYLADKTEKEYDLVSKVRGAMLYPAFIVVGMIVISIVLLIFVIPQLTAVLIESGAALPLTTRALIAVSSFMRNYFWLVIILACVGMVSFRWSLRWPDIREAYDGFKLRVPILGPLLQKIYF